MSIFIYMLVTPALYYLGSRAMITSWLWLRYPARLSLFMDCSACSGTWYGAIVGVIGGYVLGLPFLGLDGNSWPTIIIIALCSMTWTPIIAALMQWAFETLGSAVPIDDAAQGIPIAEREVKILPTVFAENPEAAKEFEKVIREQLIKERAHLSVVPEK
jgi:hypothetical protein